MPDDSSATHRAASRRFRAGDDADVDAYLLADGRFFLFCHIKNERLARDDAYAHSLAADFPDGEVVGVGRASKAEEGSLPLPPVWLGEVPGELWAMEGGLRFRLEPERVLNPGLFLDQRENRRRLGELVRRAAGSGEFGPDDGMLNLFSFTGAFSLSARHAGAHLTTSVDVSSRYLSWERKNFDANFAGVGEAPRLLRSDARDFLRRAAKKGACYRFIVIDPPTFSRSDNKAFRVREHLPAMVKDALACLPEGRFGAVLVSANDARWDEEDFFSELGHAARAADATVERGRTPPDFGAAHPLKSAWLIR
jgi:23S rRNA G2069 N7-methylase RlmK/C1962 C5-methylase RlmI